MQGLLSITPLRFGCIWPFFVHIAWYFFVHVESPVLSMTRLFPSWLQRHLSFHLRELKKSSRQVWTYRYVFMNTCVTRTSVFLHSWSADPRCWRHRSEANREFSTPSASRTSEWKILKCLFCAASRPDLSVFFPTHIHGLMHTEASVIWRRGMQEMNWERLENERRLLLISAR